MAAYLDLDGFTARTIMPASDVVALDAAAPDWIDTQLGDWSRFIDSRLAKRYAAPFVAPYPTAILGWLARLVTVRCFLKRGIDPNDAQYQTIKDDCDAALAEIKEAADSETGLFELPLRDDLTSSGISKGAPLSYSEQSPYVWTDRQVDAAFDEDASGTGTSG